MPQPIIKDTYKKYNKLVVIAFAACISICSILNILINPLNFWDIPPLGKLNAYKPEVMYYPHLVKSSEVKHYKPDVIFLGTSRIFQGLDPQYYKNNISNQRVYNLGLPAVNVFEMLNYLKHALYHNPNIKRVIIGLDFFSFLETEKSFANLSAFGFKAERLSKNSIYFPDIFNVIFSIKTLKGVFSTLYYNIFSHKQSFNYSFGFLNFEPALKNIAPLQSFSENNKAILRQYVHTPNQINSSQLEYFKEIIQICEAYNIEYKVYISPVHVLLNEILRNLGTWPIFEEWKRQVCAICPIWDFSGYNTVTLGSIYYTDSSHFTPSTGNLILNKLFSSTESDRHTFTQDEICPSDFGVLITANNIDQHLQCINRKQAEWIQNNSIAVAYIENLIQLVEEKN